MKVRIAYTVEVSDEIRRQMNAWYGRPGLASREQIQAWYRTNGESLNEYLDFNPDRANEVIE